MTLQTATASSEVAILSRVLEPENGTLPLAAARAWLKLNFSPDDQTHLHVLALKAQEGNLTPDEESALDNYCRVGRLLDLMHSKARRSLKKRGASA